MPATITTTAHKLIKAYGQRPSNVPGVNYTSFGRSGLLTPTLQTIFGIFQSATNGDYLWLDTVHGWERIYPTEEIKLVD